MYCCWHWNKLVHITRDPIATTESHSACLLTLLVCSANARNKSVHRTRRCAPSPLVFPPLVLAWLFVCSPWCVVDELVVAILVKATFQAWHFCMPAKGRLQRVVAHSWLLFRRLLPAFCRHVAAASPFSKSPLLRAFRLQTSWLASSLIL